MFNKILIANRGEIAVRIIRALRIRVCRSKNAGVAGYAEAFRPVHSDLQTSEWYSYFENDVLGTCYKIFLWRCHAIITRAMSIVAVSATGNASQIPFSWNNLSRHHKAGTRKSSCLHN